MYRYTHITVSSINSVRHIVVIHQIKCPFCLKKMNVKVNHSFILLLLSNFLVEVFHLVTKWIRFTESIFSSYD